MRRIAHQPPPSPPYPSSRLFTCELVDGTSEVSGVLLAELAASLQHLRNTTYHAHHPQPAEVGRPSAGELRRLLRMLVAQAGVLQHELAPRNRVRRRKPFARRAPRPDAAPESACQAVAVTAVAPLIRELVAAAAHARQAADRAASPGDLAAFQLIARGLLADLDRCSRRLSDGQQGLREVLPHPADGEHVRGPHR